MPKMFGAGWAPGWAEAEYRCVEIPPDWIVAPDLLVIAFLLLSFSFCFFPGDGTAFSGGVDDAITFSATNTFDRLMLPLRGPDIRKVPRSRA
jgi:hypothetical protein